MRQVTAAQIHAIKIDELGLPSSVLNLTTPEGIAGALRRAASYLCPCSSATLVRAVVGPLRGVVQDLEKAKEAVEETLDAVIGYGDILEQRDVRDEATTARVLLYAAPASFVVRQSGLVVLIGVTPDHLLPLPAELAHRIEYVGHGRKLVPSSATEDLRGELRHLGMFELTTDAWLKRPKASTALQAMATVDRDLDAVSPSRDIPGLLLLDPTKPVRFYPGRWTAPKAQTGRFVARRQQAYGADLWCYVQMTNGQPERMIDLPHRGSRWRGCDEAWHLQMGIDAQRGAPQCFRATASGEDVILEFFSPPPAWARRRWDAIGTPVSGTGSLCAYRIPATEGEEERRFIKEELWLEEFVTASR